MLRKSWFVAATVLLLAGSALAGTFGKVVSIGGHASDVALDEPRGTGSLESFIWGRAVGQHFGGLVRVVTGRSDRRWRMTFDEFVSTKLAALLRFAVVLTGDRGLAEDVVQEVLIRANARWQVIGSLPRPEAYIRKMIKTQRYKRWR